jgi:hypothetical protein
MYLLLIIYNVTADLPVTTTQLFEGDNGKNLSNLKNNIQLRLQMSAFYYLSINREVAMTTFRIFSIICQLKNQFKLV